MNDKNYNGWANYETWNVKLWLDNDEGVYRTINTEAQHLKGLPNDVSKLADFIKDYVEENTPDLGSSCYADLLNASLSEVDYYQIAEAYLED